MELEYLMTFIVGGLFGCLVTYIILYRDISRIRNDLYDYESRLTKINHQVKLYEILCDDWHKRYNTSQIEMQERQNRTNKILQELSEILGVDEVDLPSFGKVYLNQNKHIRDAMNAINLED